jgi:uncharacterized protein YhaN
MTGVRIKSLREIVFGRFTGQSFDGFDHPFVVVHGNNETGKSTLTEFITWMVGGPSGNTDNSLRFGDAPNHVTGRLFADFLGEDLEVQGKFKMRGNGRASDLRTGSLRGVELNAQSLAQRLRNLSSEDYAFIYRFIVPALHETDEDGNFSSVLSRFAIGAAASDLNPREVQKRIADEARSLTTQIGRLDTAIREANAKIKESRNRPQRISAIEKELEALNESLAVKRDAVQNLARDISFLESALNAFDAREELVAAQKALNDLPQVPSEWADAVANVAQIRTTAADIHAAVTDAHTASSTATQDAQAVGIGVDVLATATFTNVERARVRQAGMALAQATASRATVEDVVSQGAENIRSKMAAVRDAASHLGVDVTRVQSFPALNGKLDELNTSAITWRNADSSARSKATEAEKATVLADAAAKNVLVLADAEPSGAVGAKKPPVVPLVACAVLAGVGAFIHPVVSGVFAVALIVLLVRAFRSSSPQLGIGESTELVAARAKAALLAQQANDLASNAGQARIEADRCSEDFAKLLAPFGVAVPSVDFAQNTHQLLVNAYNAVAALSEAETALRTSSENLEALVAAEKSANATFTDVCSEVGVTYAGSMDDLDEWLDAYLQAVQSCRNDASKKTVVNELRRSLFGLLGNVPAVVAQYPLDRIVEEVEAHEKDQRIYLAAVEREKNARIAADAAGGEKDGVKTILEAVQTKAEIIAKKELAKEESNLLNDDVSEVQQRKGALDNERESIENVEEINDLNLRVSTLEEQREELVAQRDAKALAASTLLQVIDTFERENQAPLVKRTNELLNAVVPGYGDLIYSHSGSGPIIERDGVGGRLNSTKLSTGSRALVYLAMRLAFVEADNEQRGIALPVLCDDPLVHIDDHRAPEVIKILQQASQKRQIILFTCHEDTRDLAVAAGAHVVSL